MTEDERESAPGAGDASAPSPAERGAPPGSTRWPVLLAATALMLLALALGSWLSPPAPAAAATVPEPANPTCDRECPGGVYTHFQGWCGTGERAAVARAEARLAALGCRCRIVVDYGTAE